MSTLLYQQANLEICWDDRGWLSADWIGLQSTENVRNGCQQMLRLLQLKGTDAVLNDNTRLEGIWPGPPEWVTREWFPAMIRAGLKRFAWVEAARISQVSTEQPSKFALPAVATVFATREEAEAWLVWEASLASKRKTARITLPR